MSEPTNGDDLLDRINPTLRTIRTQICLQPDLLEDYEDAVAALAEAEESAETGRMNGPETKAVKAAQQKLDALEAKIDEVSPWFTFEALPNPDYQALVANHPPRENDQIDQFAGHNRDAVAAELIHKSLVGICADEAGEPLPVSDAGWAKLQTTCAPSQYAAMRDAALEANGGSVKPPKSQRASRRLNAPVNDSE